MPIRPEPRFLLPHSGFRSEHGDISTTLVLLMGTVAVFYGAVHGALVFNAQSVVGAAAQDALRAAQVEGGTMADGQAAGERTLSRGPDLENQSVVVTEIGDTIRVQVSAELRTVLIDVLTDLDADVSGPRERYYTESERQ